MTIYIITIIYNLGEIYLREQKLGTVRIYWERDIRRSGNDDSEYLHHASITREVPYHSVKTTSTFYKLILQIIRTRYCKLSFHGQVCAIHSYDM